ncbi:MAG: ArnT family glycosyltransferase, partial [Chloroflexota bacterium]
MAPRTSKRGPTFAFNFSSKRIRSLGTRLTRPAITGGRGMGETLRRSCDPRLLLGRAREWVRLPRAWLIAISLLIGIYSWVQFLSQDYAWLVVGIWLGGLAVFLLAVAAPLSWGPLPRRSEVIPAVIVLGVGAALRLYKFADVPYGLNQDAGYAGTVAINILHSSHYLPWSPDPTQGETFFDYWVVLFTKIFGTVPLSIRGASTLAGILTLGGMYLFTRRLLGCKPALIATFLLGTSGWHIIFSRSGWRVITLPLVEAWALYFLFRAFVTRRNGSFALAGALLALQIDTYPAGRIVPVPAGIWALVELCRGPDRADLLRGYLIASVAFLFAGASVLAFAHTNPTAFNARYNDVGVLQRILSGDWGYIWQHLKLTAGVFTVRANGNDFFLDQPLLDLPARWLFELGLAACVWLTFKRSYLYLFVL